MKIIGSKAIVGALIIGTFIGTNNVNAYNYPTTVEFTARGTESASWNDNTYIKTGFKMCTKSNVLKEQNSYNMYAWDTSNSDGELAGWPGVLMTDDGGDVYCYTLTDSYGKHYNKVIFDGGGRQTIDLSVINDTKDLVNSLAYLFEESDRQGDGKYKGKWAVNDVSALVAMVEEADSLDGNKYTAETWGAVKAALGDKIENVEDVTEDNQGDYNLGAYYISKLNLNNDVLHKLSISNEGETFGSEYLDAYNALGKAMNELEERKDIVISDDIVNGTLSAAYPEDSDNDINIKVTPNPGYQIKNITVKKILSYDQGVPQFDESDITTIDGVPGEDNYQYSFNDGNFIGLYFDAEFEARIYHITFIVGENGTIKTLSGDDIESPVNLYYGDDYSLRIVTNEGYDIDKILVNGEEYEMEDGVLTLDDIKDDLEVQISFTLKMLTVSVDGRTYSFGYGTTYEQMMEGLDLDKSGYKFMYLIDKDGNEVDSSFVVLEDAEFTAVYEKISPDDEESSESAAPDTDEGSDLAVPNTGVGQNIYRTTAASLVGCLTTAVVLAIVLVAMKRKKA